MMSGRVLSTDTAKQAIQKMQQIINGPLMEQIDALNREGQTLSDPNVWDGNLAQQFRNDWPQTHSALLKAKEAVEQLRAQSQQINQDIMTAGGNA
jgi:uncharacterized protein YukE